MRLRTGILCVLLGLAGAGCGVHVPPRYEVTDLSSGQTFSTYKDEKWGKENMMGYNFYDAETGERVMLKSYRARRVDRGGTFPESSQQVATYRAAERKLTTQRE